MRVQLVSDVHLEVSRNNGESFFKSIKTDADVLVVAGDFGGVGEIGWGIKRLCLEYPNVVYTPGNHEYWHSGVKAVNKVLTELSDELDNFYWLNRSTATIDGQRFVGCTLWFPSRMYDVFYEKGMSDFRYIENFKSWVYEANRDDTKFLRETAGPDDIVVTHYLPSERSVAPMYKNHNINRFFLGGAEDIVVDNQPKLWFHGHTHFSCDYEINDCRVLCNPYGYEPYDLNRDFNVHCVIDV